MTKERTPADEAVCQVTPWPWDWEVEPELLSDESVVYNVTSKACPRVIFRATSEKAAFRIAKVLSEDTV